MKRIKIISVLIIAAVIATACNKQQDGSETSADLSEQSETTVSETTEPSETTELSVKESEETSDTELVFERTQESIEAAWESRLEIDESEIPVIGFKPSGERFVGSLEKGSDKLTEIINSYETAVPMLLRFDSRVISLLDGVCYTTDGDKITAENAICNLDAYRSVLTELIGEKYDYYSEKTVLPNSKEEVVEIFSDPANLDCALWPDYMKLSYSFDDQDFDDFVIQLPYEEYADIISPELLPGDGISVLNRLADGLPCEYYPEGVETENMDTDCFNTFNVYNYNGKDYSCSVVKYMRTGGDESTPDDYYTNYSYVLIFDITEGKGDNAKLVYEKEYEELPEYYFYADFVNDIESLPKPEIPQVSFSDDVSADMISIAGAGYEKLDESVSVVEKDLFDSLTSDDSFIRYSLKRCDAGVLSIVGTGKGIDLVGLNFDASGNRLTLKDIMKDYDGFDSFFDEYVDTEYINTVDKVLSTQYVELDKIPELDDLDASDSWFMDADSLVFCYRNSNDRDLYIHIPYSLIKAYIKPGYLPDNGAMVAAFSMGPLETVSGRKIEFTAMDADLCDANYLKIDDAAIGTIPNGFTGGPCRFYRTNDGSEYLVLRMYLDLESDDKKDLIYVIDLTGDEWASDPKVKEDYVEGFRMPDTLKQLADVID